jgi:putative RNA 2'-phosphotransferase
MKNNLHKISKFLSLILRHQPQLINLTLDPQGWAEVNELMEKSKTKGQVFDLELLKEVVRTNDKQRFSFNDDFSKIRANQGHSINIDLGLEAVVPPNYLFHGTASRFVNNIRKEGLLKRSRQHVHLSVDVETATKVGSRHGVPVILKIESEKMHQEGFNFYLSKNGVWLVEEVPVEFILFP